MAVYEPVKPPQGSNEKLPHYRIAACIGQHVGDRQEQQDRVGIFTSERAQGCALVVLADGMGGRTGGELAAEQVINTARNLFKDFNPGHDSIVHLLTEIVREAHTVIHLSAVTSEKEPHSTMVALVLQPGRANWAHVGDSRLYYFKRQELSLKTIDHSYVEQMVRKGHLSRSQAKSHKMSHFLVSSLGTKNEPYIDFGETQNLAPEDTFLLCSDGLWAYFTDDELGEILNELPPRIASESLIDLARQRARGKGDNCTLAIVKLSPSNKA